MRFRTSKWTALLAGLVIAFASAGPISAQQTVDVIKKRDILHCGVNTGVAGFSAPDDKGRWTGFDVDICRSVAAAVLGNGEKVRFVPLSSKERFTALQSGEIDMLSRQTTQTMSRDTGLGLTFVAIAYFDGQGFMVRKSLGVKSAKDLKGATVCLQAGTTNEQNFADFTRANKLETKSVVFETADETQKALDAGRCDTISSDASQLYSQRLKMSKADDFIVLPEIISKEPLGPVVRQGDAAWMNVVKWTFNALLIAEELGITKANIDNFQSATAPDVRRLLGLEGEFGKSIGLDTDWAVKAIKAVGNYA
ncbi:MAG: amino acid ABC transporter substrate-binding protein, partial [Hyphomicrobiaceae bacterium]|nr:amino acid ABC transporter substrate-binding protein [Hyphomicrobiaceae bacterium]